MLELGYRTQVRGTVTFQPGKGPSTMLLWVGDQKIKPWIGVQAAAGQVALIWQGQPPDFVRVKAGAKPPATGRWQLRLEVDRGLVQAKVWADGEEEPRDWQLARYIAGTIGFQPQGVGVGCSGGTAELESWQVRSSRREQWTAEQERHQQEILRCHVEALRLYRLGKRPEALEQKRQVLEISRKGFPPDHFLVAIAVNELGLLLMDMGKYSEARPLLEEALEIYRKVLPPDHPEVAGTMKALGAVLQEMRQYSGARSLLEESLRARRKTLPADHADLADYLNRLGILLDAMGKSAEARPLLEELVKICRKAFPPDHPQLASSLYNLGLLLQELGHYADAHPLLEEAVKIRRKALPPDHPDLALSLGRLGMVLLAMGKYVEAKPLLEEALKIQRKALPPHHPQLALTLLGMGALLREMGQQADALGLLEEAVKIHRQALPPDHPDLADSLSNLALLLEGMGKYDEAWPLYEQALRIYRKALPPGHPRLASCLNNMGVLLAKLEKLAEARPLLEEALKIQRQALPADHPVVAQFLDNLAQVLSKMGEHDEARLLYEQVVTIHRKVLPPDHPHVAQSLDNLARLLIEMGKDAEARPQLEEAVKIRRKALPPDHPSLAESLNHLGLLLQRAGEPRPAFDLLHEAVEALANHVRSTTAASAQADHAAIISRSRYGLHQFLTQAAQTLAAEDPRWSKVLTAVLESKSLSTTALAIRREALLTSSDPQAQRLLEQLRPRQQELADLLLRGAGKLSPDDYRHRCRQLRQECDDLERRLGALSRAYAEEHHARRATPTDLARALPAEAVCIEFLRTFAWNFKARRWHGAPRYVALVLRASDSDSHAPQVSFVDLGEETGIDTAIEAWRAAVRKGRSDPAAERRLRELLWEPLFQLLPEKTTRLYLAPDGQLALVPFEAIRLDDGRFLIERYRISYLNSGRDLMPRPRPEKTPDAAVVLADPDYDAVGDDAPPRKPDTIAAATDLQRDLVFGGGAPRRLPGFVREADAAAKLLDACKGSRRVALRGAAATEEAVRASPRPRLLYCITHGYFLPDAPRPAPESFTRELGLFGDTPRLRLPDVGPDPRLRSGLVLAGANQWRERIKKGLSDGLLTAKEVEEQLDLWGTELVILSACDTGRGEVSRIGEGVLGLRRAFQLAGAECVLASLWPVEDRATELLLQDFLRRWLDGKPPATALREAQLAAIAESRKSKNKRLAEAPPLLWAGFICHGGRSEKP
jgi:tetratricopeptide (TPR) repeat protein/CHAT domain-containing protein